MTNANHMPGEEGKRQGKSKYADNYAIISLGIFGFKKRATMFCSPLILLDELQVDQYLKCCSPASLE
jgi:hypothetical protein